MVYVTPLTFRFARFHELIYVPRLLDCQQKVPTPSWVKGAVILAVTGLHTKPVATVGEAGGVPVSVIVLVGVTVGVLTPRVAV